MGRFYMYKPLSHNDYSQRIALLSIVLGIICMLIFYFFQQYLFVLFRSALLALEFNVNHILSEDIGSLISYIFAGNAVIIGNSVGISFYISGVSKTIKKRFRKRDVLNNQTFVIGSYFFWFFKIAVLMGTLPTILLIPGLFEYVLEIYALLFIVLFLESIKEVRRSFKGYSLRVLFLHFLLIIGVGLTLTCINKSNYYKLGILYNDFNAFVNIPLIKMDTPKIVYDYETYDNQAILHYNRYSSVPIKVISDSSSLIYRFYDETLSLAEVVETPFDEKYNYHIKYNTHTYINIYADRDLMYYRLKDLENEIVLKGLNKVVYVIYSTKDHREYEYSKSLYFTSENFESLGEGISPSSPLPEILYLKTFSRDKKEIPIALSAFKIKNQIDTEKVYNYFQESVSDRVYFNFKISKQITLQEYLDFMITYKQSVYDLRDEERRKNQALNRYKESGVKDKYPFLFIEEIE